MPQIFLGPRSPFGEQQMGCTCRTCSSTDPRDKRTRTSAVIESDGRRLLIDTAPELRLQLVAAALASVDAVLFTHGHADHVHGIDDLRAISVKHAGGLPVYGPGDTLAAMSRRFAYIFDPDVAAAPGTTQPELHAHAPEPDPDTAIARMPVRPLRLPPGSGSVFG